MKSSVDLIPSQNTSLSGSSDSCQTTCPYCGVGCGVQVSVTDAQQRKISVSGDKQHPANFGRLCSKGSALADTVSTEGRLLTPMIDQQPADWDQATTTVASRLNSTIEQYGPSAVALYGSGQLMTEAYYVANKLMKGFIGSAHIDTNSRLCMSSAVSAYKRAFGSDTVPCQYQDLEQARLIVLVGSNAAWCHPVLFQRIKAARQQYGCKVVVIDPRRTATCDIADLHLAIKPKTDIGLFMGLLAHLQREQAIDHDYLKRYTTDSEQTLARATNAFPDLATTAEYCQVSTSDLTRFYQWFTETGQVVTAYSQGVNQSVYGTDTANSIINVHLATGRIGKPGSGPFSLTGQPNAMGGREVGGLANTLAAHMEFNPKDIDRVRRFWDAPAMATNAGHKAVDLFDAIDRGEIRAVWIMATNPLVSLPDSTRILRALKRCDLVVVSDCMARTDTGDVADILLPSTTWGEREGTVTNSERRLSRQRAFLPAVGQARDDWWIISQVATKMGFQKAFDYQNAAEIFREHCALTGFENNHQRDLDLSVLASLSDQQFDQLPPTQWPLSTSSRPFADGRFYHPDGKARLIDINLPVLDSKKAATIIDNTTPGYTTESDYNTTPDYPWILNTGRVRDQWHTMSRTGLAPRLNRHIAEPTVFIHPADAGSAGLKEADIAHLESNTGNMLAKVRCTTDQTQGQLFVPIHWTSQNSSQGKVSPLVHSLTDPVSGQPCSKSTAVSISVWPNLWQGLLYSRSRLRINELRRHPDDYVVEVKEQKCYRYFLASLEPITDFPQFARQLFTENTKSTESTDSKLSNQNTQWLEFQEDDAASYRAFRLHEGMLENAIFLATGADANSMLPSTNWLDQLFCQPIVNFDELSQLLALQRPAHIHDDGPTICSCFGVGERRIQQCIRQQQPDSVATLGQLIKAGSNCGSCIPELQQLLEQSSEHSKEQPKHSISGHSISEHACK